MKYNNKNEDTIVMLFAKIIEGLLIKKPYRSHKTIPVKNINNIGNESPETSLVRQVL